MFNLVPELIAAPRCSSIGCLTNMLDCGAEHFKLRKRTALHFFSGNNCGRIWHSANLLMGVSHRAMIQFADRCVAGGPITVAGNPP